MSTKPRLASRRLSGRCRRAAVLDAAALAFREHGFDGCLMDEIARQSTALMDQAGYRTATVWMVKADRPA